MFHGGFKHSKTIKALGLRPRAFISFLVFETPMKHSHSFLKYYLKTTLMFSIVLDNLKSKLKGKKKLLEKCRKGGPFSLDFNLVFVFVDRIKRTCFHSVL